MTPQQAKVFVLVRNSIKCNEYSPTLQEIAEAIGRNKTTAKRLVDALVEKGYLTRAPYRSRSLSLPGGHNAPTCADQGVLQAARAVLDRIIHEDVTVGVVTVTSAAIGELDIAVMKI